MKVRNDFVTNSSSSSYVIAYRENVEVDDETVKKYPFVKLYSKLIQALIDADGFCETEIADVYKTQEEFDKYFLDNYGLRGETINDIVKRDDYCRTEYEKASKYLSDGYYIMKKWIDYSDDSLKDVIVAMSDNDNFIILERCE